MTRAAAAARLAVAALAGLGVACSTPPIEPARDLLRVGTSGDYPPWTELGQAADGAAIWSGFEPEAARRFAADTNLRVVFVRFRWPELLRDLEAGRFDVAMSGITVRPERSLVGAFSVPFAETGAVPLVREAARFATAEALDAPGVRLAVNAGGHLEAVARARFPRSRILPLAANAAVPEALAAGEVDAVLTDDTEAALWLAKVPGAVALPPLTRDRKAWLVRAGRPDLVASLDRWLLEAEASGRLAALREAHLGAATREPIALPGPALVAAVLERLSLMPWIAESKRRTAVPIHVPEREARVLAAGEATVLAEAERLGGIPPSPERVREFFRAQFAAARALQVVALTGPPDDEPVRDLAALRAALQRITARQARLIARLPAAGDRDALRDAARTALLRSGVPEEPAAALAAAIAALPPDAAELEPAPSAGAATEPPNGPPAPPPRPNAAPQPGV